MNNIIKLEENTKYEITLSAQWCGKDLNVAIFGGETPHIGAVELAIANIEGYNRKYSPTLNVLTVLDHKDDEIARFAAKDLAIYFNTQVVVTAGVHIDNATNEDLIKIMANITEILHCLKLKYPKE